MKRLVQHFPLLILTALLAGCAGLSGGNVSFEKFNQLRPEVISERRLEVGDILEFSVETAGKPEVLRQQVKLGHDGLITVPLAGDLHVAGYTLTEARQALQNAYRSFYVAEPLVMLSVQTEQGEGAWGAVTILGEVQSPGRVPLSSASLRLSEVVQRAGGFSGAARQDAVKISRENPDGKRVQCIVDFRMIGQQGRSDCDLELFADDVVYVPERLF